MNRCALPWPAGMAPADLVVGDCVELANALVS
jgi:hypothetical protein